MDNWKKNVFQPWNCTTSSRLTHLGQAFTPYPILLPCCVWTHCGLEQGGREANSTELRRAQPPQALTMLLQMSNGLSDHQGNRRLIRALLPETGKRQKVTNDWSSLPCTQPWDLKLPECVPTLTGMTEYLAIPVSLIHPLFPSWEGIHWTKSGLITTPQEYFSVLHKNHHT